MALDPTLVALFGTIMGGVGLKVAEAYLSKGKVRIDDATQIRDELRLELTTLRAENKALEAQVDQWRNDYYSLRDTNVMLRTHMVVHGLSPPEDEDK